MDGIRKQVDGYLHIAQSVGWLVVDGVVKRTPLRLMPFGPGKG